MGNYVTAEQIYVARKKHLCSLAAGKTSSTSDKVNAKIFYICMSNNRDVHKVSRVWKIRLSPLERKSICLILVRVDGFN